MTVDAITSADVLQGAAPADKARWRSSTGKLAYLLLAPSLAILGLFTYLPILRVAYDSLHRSAGPGGSANSFVGLENFHRLAADEAFTAAVTNNLLYAAGTIIPSIALALFLAVLLRRTSYFTTVVRTALFFPSLIPLVAAAALFFFIFLPGVGLLDFYLARIGLQGPNWLGDSDVALLSLMALTIWKNAGYYMLFFVAGLQNVPAEQIEAATIDGANGWQRFRHVVLPALRPTTAFVVTIATVQTLTAVDHIVVLTKGGPSNATNLVLFYIFQEAHENFDYGKAAAATLLSLGALLALSFVGLRRLSPADPA